MILRFLLEKEFKQLLRNTFLPRLVLMMPIMMMLILPWAANQEIKNCNLVLVDLDHSALSSQLARKVVASGYFRLTATAASGPQALQTVEAGRADAILEIPRGFERQLMREGTAPVAISANGVNGVKGSLATSYLAAIVADFTRQLARGTQAAQPPVGIGWRFLFNPHLDYKVFMIPAMMAMLLTMLTGFLPALNIVSEKEKGTIEQINVTPVPKALFILAKLIPYWLIGLVVLTVTFGLAAGIYHLFPAGQLATIYLVAVVHILVVSGMGIIISNNSATMQQAMFVMLFFMITMFLMSGLLTPVASMPTWAQAIAAVNPMTYFIDVVRKVYLKGSTLADLWPQLCTLAGFALLFNAGAVLTYRKSQ